MSRQLFLTIVSPIAFIIGCFALLAPDIMIQHVKHAQGCPVANVMGRTVGVLLLTISLLNFLVRKHPDSETMKAILIANLGLQVAILPIDPHAFFTGVYSGFDSFAPNTVLHAILIFGFFYYIRKMRKDESQKI